MSVVAANTHAPPPGTAEVSGEHARRAGADDAAGPVASAEATAAEAIIEANRELEARTQEQLELAIAVLLQQRDQALKAAAEATLRADEERDKLNAEHDRFVAFLMEEQDGRLDAVQKELSQAKKRLERQQALGTAANVAVTTGATPQLADVRRLLEEAYAELDETRAAVSRLEEERDQALAAADDVRVQIYTQVESARDEAITLQAQLDDAGRQLEEAQDRARDEAIELTARLDDAKRELDERRGEVTRLRARLSELEEVKNSRPPPPLVSEELIKAREENQTLRKELIDAKRALSRVTREYDILRSLRSRIAAKKGTMTGTEVAASTLQRNVAASRATLAGAPIPVLPVVRPSPTASEAAPSVEPNADAQGSGNALPAIDAAPGHASETAAPTAGASSGPPPLPLIHPWPQPAAASADVHGQHVVPANDREQSSPRLSPVQASSPPLGVGSELEVTPAADGSGVGYSSSDEDPQAAEAHVAEPASAR